MCMPIYISCVLSQITQTDRLYILENQYTSEKKNYDYMSTQTEHEQLINNLELILRQFFKTPLGNTEIYIVAYIKGS